MSFPGSEIITFQFGHYSNFIGTHWWNSQEAGFEYIPGTQSEINHDVLFREGQTPRGEVTYTPRLLLVDLKGTLGSLPEAGRLYETPPHADATLPLWPADKVCVESQDSEPKNEFLRDVELGETSAATLPEGLKERGHAVPKLYHLDDSVKSWSDFLRPHLHPRSINLVQEYQHGDQSLPFDTFPQGHAVWSRPRFNEEFTDRIRLYMEETDNLQGFQLLVDSFDGFSGLGCAGLQHLRDEYPSKSAVCFSCQPPQTTSPISSRHDCVRVLNQALTLSSLAEHTSLFVPVSGSTKAWRDMGLPVKLPHLNYRPELYYHTAAVLVAGLDSVSLVYRLHSNRVRLADLTARLSAWGRLAAALSLSVFPLQMGHTLLDTLEQWAGPLTHPLIPLNHTHSGLWVQEYVLRGIPESRLMRADQRNSSPDNPAYSCRTLAQLVKTYLMFDGQTTALTQVTTADSALNTDAPFPQIFQPNISPEGQLDSESRPSHLGVSRVPMLAGLHSCQSIGPLLESLHSEAKRINIRNLHQFTDSGLESTELLESLEQLLCLSECYSDNQMDL